jgi:hypothetical protein
LFYAGDKRLYQEISHEKDGMKRRQNVNMVYNWNVENALGFKVKNAIC